MLVVSLLILFIIILRIIIGNLNSSQSYRHKLESIFCNIAYLCIVILAMFRGENVGTDTLGYISDYNDMALVGIDEIFDNYIGYWGYFLPSKLCSICGFPYYIWFGILELILIVAIARLINRHSQDRLYSIILFLTTGLFMFSLSGLKQVLGIALILNAFVDFEEKKYIRSGLLLLYSYFVHPASLILVIAFILYVLRDRKIFLPFIISIICMICLGELYAASLMASIISNEHFEIYLEANYSYTKSTLYLFCLIILCTMPYFLRYYRSSSVSKVEVACALLTCSLQYLASFSPSLFRLALPLLPFLFVYVPNAFNVVNKKDFGRNVLKLLALLGPIVFYMYSNRNFVFTFITL